MQKVAIIHHSNGRKERRIMKKLAIISTGLLLGFFVFLTGFPTAATAHHHIKECKRTSCLDKLPLTPGQRANAEVLVVFGKGNKVILIQIEGNTVSPDAAIPNHDSIQRPTPIPEDGSRSTIIFQPRASGCVTINGRNYCW